MSSMRYDCDVGGLAEQVRVPVLDIASTSLGSPARVDSLQFRVFHSRGMLWAARHPPALLGGFCGARYRKTVPFLSLPAQRLARLC